MKRRCLMMGVLLMGGCQAAWCDANVVGAPADASRDAGITIMPTPYPMDTKGEIGSGNGHRFILRDVLGGSGHTNEPTVFIRAPDGAGIRLNFKDVYWETTECKWVNENLLFVRIWWGRQWGTDYIFNADTAKIAYREGFAVPRGPLHSQ